MLGCWGVVGLTLTLSQSSNRCLPAAQGRWWKKSAPATSSVVTISLFGLSSFHRSPRPSCTSFLSRASSRSLMSFRFDPLPDLRSARFSYFSSNFDRLNWADSNWQCTHLHPHTHTHTRSDTNTPEQLCPPSPLLPRHGLLTTLPRIPCCCSQSWLSVSSFLFSSILFSMTRQFLSEQLCD